MRELETLIVGAGVTGVALARALARGGATRIAVAEKEPGVARHASGHNSGVVHAGYNPRPGTLKARLCVDGNRLLREFCNQRGVPLVVSGILIVATRPTELERLDELKRRGDESGVPGLRLLDSAAIQTIEPNAAGIAALHAPSGGSVDSGAYVAALAAEAEELGVEVLLGRAVDRIERSGTGFTAMVGDERVRCERLVNCAGLHADSIAHSLGAGRDYGIVPVRGEYALIRQERSDLIRSMIYPVPDLAFPFLGVHWTKTAHGTVKLGPNAVPALGREAYSWRQSSLGGAFGLAADARAWRLLRQPGVAKLIMGQVHTSLSRRRMAAAARELVPGVRDDDLRPGPAGIRAQLVDRRGLMVEDLLVEQNDGAIHVLNVVSPGLTCSLAFADHLVSQFL